MEASGYAVYSRGRSASVNLSSGAGTGAGAGVGAVRRPSYTQALCSADRFIPTRRRASELDMAYYRMTSPLSSGGGTGTASPFSVDRGNLPDSAAGAPSQRRTDSDRTQERSRILHFSPDTGSNTDPVTNLRHRFESLSSSGGSPVSPKTPSRYIWGQPDHIFDMPDLQDDFYSNVLTWSRRNQIAIALDDDVYLWNAEDGARQELSSEASLAYSHSWPYPKPQILSLAWDPSGALLAIGTEAGGIMLWDAQKKKLSHMCCTEMECPHHCGVTCLVWDPQEKGAVKSIYSGQLCGCVCRYLWDREGRVLGSARFKPGHGQAVCGLALAPDSKKLATGGDDNILRVWNTQQVTLRRTIAAHTAAIKAVVWCPWQSNIVASGGGSGDGHIRVWNITTGACIAEADTGSQVCSLAWSADVRDLASGHGQEHNDVLIWRWPGLILQSRLSRHDGRVLHLAISPHGHTLASAGADEVLILWRCFEGSNKARRRSSACQPMSPLTFSIR